MSFWSLWPSRFCTMLSGVDEYYRPQRIACLNNLKQVGLGLQMLASDNNGWVNGTESSEATPYVAWTGPVTNYLGKSDNLVKGNSNQGCPSRRLGMAHWAYTPYGVNNMFSGNGYGPVHSLYETKNSSRVFLVAETWVWNVYGGQQFDDYAIKHSDYPHQKGVFR